MQNEYSNVYEIEEVNQNVIKNILQSRFIGEGVYTVEQYSLGDYIENYITSPSFDKYQYQKTNREWQFGK